MTTGRKAQQLAKPVEAKKKLTLEELIEEQRAALHTNLKPGESLTMVTAETFRAWKRRKLLEKRKQAELDVASKKAMLAKGLTSKISGRELFTHAGKAVEKDDDEADDGSIDYAKLRAEEEAAKRAAAGEAGGAAAEEEPKAMVVDESLFMGDLDAGLEEELSVMLAAEAAAKEEEERAKAKLLEKPTEVMSYKSYEKIRMAQMAIEDPGKSSSTYRSRIKEEWHSSPCNANATAPAAAGADGAAEVAVDSAVFAAESLEGVSAADLG